MPSYHHGAHEIVVRSYNMLKHCRPGTFLSGSSSLSMVLHAVISQRLLPTTDGKMVPAFEIMVLTPAIRNIIREGKTHQIDGMIYTSTNENMLAMDTSIFRLYQKGIIDKKTALANASNPEMMSKKIGAI